MTDRITPTAGPRKLSTNKGVRFDDGKNTSKTIVEEIGEEIHASFSAGDDIQAFNTAKVAFTPKIGHVRYKNPEQRAAAVIAPPSSISRPNHEDNMRRVSVVIHQHIQKCESRLKRATPENSETGLFHTSKMIKFSDENYITPRYVYHFVRIPVVRMGMVYSIRKVRQEPTSPTLNEVHSFLYELFIKANLSAECSIGNYLPFNFLSLDDLCFFG